MNVNNKSSFAYPHTQNDNRLLSNWRTKRNSGSKNKWPHKQSCKMCTALTFDVSASSAATVSSAHSSAAHAATWAAAAAATAATTTTEPVRTVVWARAPTHSSHLSAHASTWAGRIANLGQATLEDFYVPTMAIHTNEIPTLHTCASVYHHLGMKHRHEPQAACTYIVMIVANH